MGFPDQVRIQSDGLGSDTRLTLSDGTLIPNVVSATIWMEAGEVNRVDFTVRLPTHDVHARPSSIYFSCPCCNAQLDHECDHSL